MLDNKDGVSLVHQFLEHVQKHFNVFGVETGGGFVKDVEGVAGSRAEELGRQFHPLAFSSGEGHRTLTQVHVTQSHVLVCLEFLGYLRNRLEEFVGFRNGHFKHVVDVFPLIVDGEGVFLVPPSPALVADHIHGREEIHLYHLDAGALAFLATTTGHVERESSGPEATHFRIRCFCE